MAGTEATTDATQDWAVVGDRIRAAREVLGEYNINPEKGYQAKK